MLRWHTGMSPSWIDPNAMSVTCSMQVSSARRRCSTRRLRVAARNSLRPRRMMPDTNVSARMTSKV